MPKRSLHIKVCGMRDVHNVEALAMLPVDYIGFIFYEKSKRYIERLPQVTLRNDQKRVGVFVNATEDDILDKVKQGLQAVQLHGEESPILCQKVKQSGVAVIKAFGIHENFDWDTLKAYEAHVDYFLFDTSSPQHGGTGAPFDWNILAGYPLSIPYFLSGGIGPENMDIARNIQDERLFGLDLNSRFEIQPGLKDIALLRDTLKINKE